MEQLKSMGVMEDNIRHSSQLLRKLVMFFKEDIVESPEMFCFAGQCLAFVRDITDFPEMRIDNKMEEEMTTKVEEFALRAGIAVTSRVENELREACAF